MCYTTVYRGINSLTLTYTTRDSCMTYNKLILKTVTSVQYRKVTHINMLMQQAVSQWWCLFLWERMDVLQIF